MRVGELIEKLKEFDPDDVVVYDIKPMLNAFGGSLENLERRTEGAVEVFEQGWGKIIISERELNYTDQRSFKR